MELKLFDSNRLVCVFRFVSADKKNHQNLRVNLKFSLFFLIDYKSNPKFLAQNAFLQILSRLSLANAFNKEI